MSETNVEGAIAGAWVLTIDRLLYEAGYDADQRAAAFEAIAPADRADHEGAWLIWSNEHRAWWRANRCGYTTHIEAAGRYSHEDAIEICRDAHSGWVPGDVPPEMPVAETDALACARIPASTETRGSET